MKARTEGQQNSAKAKAKCAGGWRAIFRSESGQSLLELALLTPILLSLVIGVVEMGRYTSLSIVVGNAAEAGAEYGAQNLANSGDTTGIEAAATADFQNSGASVSNLTFVPAPSNACGCDNGGTTTTVSCTSVGAGSCASGHWVVTVTVTAVGTFNSLFTYPGIPPSLTISRAVTMRVKQS